jgi:magnesium-transporting ATPase (P-type)
LAIGLTPQLLPAIISVNLSHGAKRMANEKVIVKRLESIENLGTMDVLCTDKTGTITTGELKLHSCIDVTGKNNKKIYLYGYLNALFETGYTNPIDRAIIECKQIVDNHDNDVSSKFIKLDEIPYDFIRKRLSVLVSLKANDTYKKTNQIPYKNKDILITKGDYITFAVLLVVLNATTEQFRTAWFMESVISASTIVLIVRTRNRAYKSKPSKYLVSFTFVAIVLVILIPYTPIGEIFGFVGVPLVYLLIIGLIVLAYISVAEMVKMRFYRKNHN